jgi:hypothetical protein
VKVAVRAHRPVALAAGLADTETAKAVTAKAVTSAEEEVMGTAPMTASSAAEVAHSV